MRSYLLIPLTDSRPPDMSNSPEPGETPLNTTQLELLLHFCTETYRTLNSEESDLAGWQIAAPRLGLQHPYLMHAILAMSAAHLAHLRPLYHSRYSSLTSEHIISAISIFRKTVESDEMPDLLAVSYFSKLIAVHGFVVPKTPGDIGLAQPGGSAGWMSLMRGIRSILTDLYRKEHHISEEVIQAASKENEAKIIYHPDYKGSTGNPEVDKHFADLSNLCSSDLFPAAASAVPVLNTTTISSSSSSNSDPESPRSASIGDTFIDNQRVSPLQEVKKTYMDTLAILKASFHRYYTTLPGGSKGLPVFTMIAFASPEYIELLSKHDAIALIILAHYCVLLDQLDSWWVDGWARHTLESIESLVGPEWKPWLRWPQNTLRK
jgi:hypothetical protein